MKKTPLILSFILLSIATSAQITSTFDANADGWTYVSSATPITVNHQSTGGNPGGYASVTYSSNAGSTTQNWIAPAKFLGSHLARSMGLNLKLDLQQSQAGTTSGYDVRIDNGGNFIYFTLPVKPAVAPAWSSYSLPLDENTGWKYNGGGTNATREQIRSILINITSLIIRGAYATNASYTSGLDNVVLEQRILPVAPSITSLSATSGEPGTTLTINGSDFDPTPANNAVYFGKITGTITSASATQLTVTIPVGAQYGPINVLNKTTGVSNLSPQPFNPTFSGGGRIIPASFDPKSDINLSIDIEGLSMADIDGDGWLDLAVASSAGFKAIEIYRNLGLGGDLTAASFAPKITVTIPGTSTNTTGLQFADLDGDGKLDVVTSNVLVTFGGSYFITYRNISTPGNIAFEPYETWYGLTDDSAPSLVADIDGDGRPELIGGEGSYSTGAYFWIAQNISTPGDIEYGASVGYFTLGSNGGFGAASMGDLDNDGKPEMLVTYGDRFSIFKNNSTPGTISLTDIGMVSHFQYVSNLQVADFNLDGRNDLIWKRTGNGEFYIRLNTNSGGALATTDFTTEIILSGDLSTYGGMSIADINGDGKPDIVACDNGNVGVFENTFSSGVFDATAFVPAYAHQGNGGGTYPTSPLIGDLNGDNKPEIIIGTTNASPQRISIYENKNIHAPVISLNTVSPLKGDVGSTVTITGNNFSTVPSENKVWFGRVEATVLTSTANLITVAVPAGASNAPVSVTRNGLTSRYRVPFQTTFGPGVTFDNTHFAPPVSYTLTGAIYDIETGDLNRDGKLDIIALGTASNTYAFRNVYTTGAINSSSLVADDTLAGSLNPRLEDFDGDGYFDVMSVNGPLRKNNSTLTEISFLPIVNVPLGASIVDFGDFNNDGKPDMTLTTDLSGAGDLIVLENRTTNISGNFVAGGFGSFSGNFIYNKPAPSGATITGDFDSDGFADIVTTNPIADNISIYRNLGVLKISQAQFATRVDVAVGDNPGRIYKGDFDSDGKLDLLLYHGTGTSTTLLIVLQNTSTVGNISFSRIDLTNPNVVTVAHIADLDGDGRPEILTTAEANNRFSIFKNIHTSGALTAASFAAPFNTTVTAPRGITTGNLNSDSKPEIIITRAAGLLVVYENLIPAAPTITSFTPTSGQVGATVTITGTNFDPTPSNNTVAFNGTTAVVTASTATTITTTVPAGATTGKITVTVGGNTATSATDFTVIQNFITRWNLATTGSGPTQLSFSTATSGSVNYTWQEISPGTASGSGSWSGATLTITGLPTGATIRLQIEPTNFQRIMINSGTDRNRLTQVEQWGTTAWTSMQRAFLNCANLQVTATDVPDLSGVTTMSEMFRGCGTLNSPSNIGSWNTSAVTDMSSLFSLASAFNQNISSWNTAAVTNMSGMFADAAAFNQDIGAWNTAAVTNMNSVFAGALVFNRNIGAWSTAAVTNMSAMFYSAYVFNQNIGGWNTAAVTNMSSMFGYARDFNQNIGTWNTAAVTNMSRMFEDAFDFNQNIGTWNTSAVTNMNGMFIDAYAFNQNIGTWNTAAVTNMQRMFDFATAFNQNIGAWNTAAVTSMSGMFADASAFNQSLGTWSLNPGVILTGMLNNSSIDCNNYSATLIGWSTNPSTPNGRILGATGRQYGTNAGAARTNLTTTKGWTITGDAASATACSSLPIPTVTNFTPSSGPVGTTVTITGTNFSTTLINNIVYFGATQAVVTAATATQLTVTVPIGATYEPITVTIAGLIAYSGKSFTPTFTGGTVDVCSYAPKVDFTTASAPADISIADLDGDGKNDLALENGSNMSVLRNTSSGPGSIAYAAKIDFITGSSPTSIFTGDLDGDGKLDLVICNQLSNTLSVYRNTSTSGSVTYAPKADFITGTRPYSVTIRDLDKDGKADLAVANYASTTISVFRNTSSGTGNINFAAKVDFTAAAGPYSIAAEDFDADGRDDLAVANWNGNTVSVFRNTGTVPGSISFAAKVDFVSGTTPFSISIGDFDGDAKSDIAVANINSNSISVFRNTSSGLGNVNFDAKVDLTTGTEPVTVSTGDLDGDGKIDLAVTNNVSNTVSLFRNTSAGSGSINYATKIDLTTDLNPYAVSMGDLDGDGRTDLVVTNFGSNTLSVFRSTIPVVPSITSFSPTTGNAGSIIIITGTNFSTTPANNIVSFNGTTAVVTASTATSITTTVPVGTTSGTITVTVGCNAGTSATNFIVAGATTNQPPQITTTSASVPIQGIITIDLEELISDPDDNLDPSTLQIITQPLSGAVASLNNFMLTIDYAGVAFSGTDQIEIGICDLSGVCTQQELTLELAGEIEVFNALSPNGDGKNDFLFMRYIELLPNTQSNHVSIYNRWGDVVWEGSNYNNQTIVFDGTNKNGKELPSGTYFYKIDFSSGLESKTGFLSLKR